MVRIGLSEARRRLSELAYGLFASSDDLMKRGSPVTPADLADHDLPAFTGGRHRGVWTFQAADAELRIEPFPRLGINNSFALREAAAQGLGIAVLPERIAESPGGSCSLQRVLPAWKPPSLPVHAVFSGSRDLTPKARAFVDLAVEALAGAERRGPAGRRFRRRSREARAVRPVFLHCSARQTRSKSTPAFPRS